MQLVGKTIRITDFCKRAGLPLRCEDSFSAQEWYEDRLSPAYIDATMEGFNLIIDMSGMVDGYCYGFICYAFGRLAREYGTNDVLSRVNVICNDHPGWVDFILRTIKLVPEHHSQEVKFVPRS